MNVQEALQLVGHSPVRGWGEEEMIEIFEAFQEVTKNPKFLMSMAYELGMISGKREERARRRKRNANRQYTDLKQQIMELVEEASNNESLELIYRFCKKLMQE